MATINIPLQGSNVIPDYPVPEQQPQQVNEKVVAPSSQQAGFADRAARSLHRVKFPRQVEQTTVEPQFNEHGHLSWSEAQQANTPPTEQTYTLEQISEAYSMMQNQNQYSGSSQSQESEPEADYEPDLYDSRDLQAYIQAKVQEGVEKALNQHRPALQSAEYSRQYNSVLADHSSDPDFKQTMDKALEMVSSSNGKFTIPEAYEMVANQQSRRSEGPRSARSIKALEHLPEGLRSGKSVNSLGKIMEHHFQSRQARKIS